MIIKFTVTLSDATVAAFTKQQVAWNDGVPRGHDGSRIKNELVKALQDKIASVNSSIDDDPDDDPDYDEDDDAAANPDIDDDALDDLEDEDDDA